MTSCLFLVTTSIIPVAHHPIPLSPGRPSDTPCHSGLLAVTSHVRRECCSPGFVSPTLSEHSQDTPVVSILPHTGLHLRGPPFVPVPSAAPASSLSCSSLIPGEKLFKSSNLLKFLVWFPLPNNKAFFNILSKLHSVQMGQVTKEC